MGNNDLRKDLFGIPQVAVYIYEAGSPFEIVMNRYMISGKGINPFDPRGFGTQGIELNVTAVGTTRDANAVLI